MRGRRSKATETETDESTTSLSIDLGASEEDARPAKRPWLGKRLWMRFTHLLGAWWDQWLETMPRDDDAPKGLPRWLHGLRGRLIMGSVTIVVLVGWLIVIVLVVT